MLFLASKLAVKAFIHTIIPYGICPERKKNQNHIVTTIALVQKARQITDGGETPGTDKYKQAL